MLIYLYIYQTLLWGGGVYERTKKNLKVCFNEFVCPFVAMAVLIGPKFVYQRSPWPQGSGKFYGYVNIKNVAISLNGQNNLNNPK